MLVLLTGSAGYLGRLVEDRLTRSGHDVRGLDAGFFDTRQGRTAGWRDIRDISLSDLERVDAVVHLAALSSEACASMNPHLAHVLNAQESGRLARLARCAGVQRFVLASTCSVYGAAGGQCVTEDGPLRPIDTYAMTKVQAEQRVLAQSGDGFVPVVLRFGTLFGVSPNMRTDLVVNQMTAAAVASGIVTVHGDGLQRRPFLHVADAAVAVEFALTCQVPDPANPCFNVAATDGTLRIRDLAELVSRVVSGTQVAMVDASHDSRDYAADCSRLSASGLSFDADLEARIHELAEYSVSVGRFPTAVARAPGARAARLAELIADGWLDRNLRWLPVVTELAG